MYFDNMIIFNKGINLFSEYFKFVTILLAYLKGLADFSVRAT